MFTTITAHLLISTKPTELMVMWWQLDCNSTPSTHHINKDKN